jgi:hypothetical protein
MRRSVQMSRGVLQSGLLVIKAPAYETCESGVAARDSPRLSRAGSRTGHRGLDDIGVGSPPRRRAP